METQNVDGENLPAAEAPGSISSSNSGEHSITDKPWYDIMTEKIVEKKSKLASNRMYLEGRPCQPSIYRVPDHLRKLNKQAYTPLHVSVGPYHHRNHKYRVVDEHKFDYMMALIAKKTCENCHLNLQVQSCGCSVDVKVREYIEKLDKLDPDPRLSYAEEIELTKEEFVEMLLIDGCFIVEFLCRKIRKLTYLNEEPTKDEYKKMYDFIEERYKSWHPSKDFIFQSTRTSFEVRRDLTLLENQLPYSVIKEIYEFTFKGEEGKPDFRDIVYCALRTSIPNTKHIITKSDLDERIKEPDISIHLVSFLKICCAPKKNGGRSSEQTEESMRRRDVIVPVNKDFPCLCDMKTHDARVPTATKLAEAGVVFRATGNNSCSKPLLDICIDLDNNVLIIPELIMWHHTETFFRNAMAYELYNHAANGDDDKSISDYLCFMDDLINTKQDVALLVENGIIQNWLESDEVVSNLFNSITKNILADYASYSKICKGLNGFRRSPNMRWLKGVLRREFFNEPKAIMYFVTGVLVQTVASVAQTVVTFRSSK